MMCKRQIRIIGIIEWLNYSLHFIRMYIYNKKTVQKIGKLHENMHVA